MSTSQQIAVQYDQPTSANTCSTAQVWAKVPTEPPSTERAALKQQIKELLAEKNAVLVAHYYVHPDLQDLAEETGGIVSDSLEMARFGRDHAEQTLVVAVFRVLRFHYRRSKVEDQRLQCEDRDVQVLSLLDLLLYCLL